MLKVLGYRNRKIDGMVLTGSHILLPLGILLSIPAALGSMSALGWLLKDMGKEFVLYSPSGVPDYLSFLPMPCTLLTSLERLPFEPQALVLLDCGEPHRLGDDLAAAVVDDNDAVFHLGDVFLPDDAGVELHERHLEAQHIRAGEEIVELHEFHAQITGGL